MAGLGKEQLVIVMASNGQVVIDWSMARPGFGNINTRIMMNGSKRKYLSRRLISKLLKEIKSRIVTIQGS